MKKFLTLVALAATTLVSAQETAVETEATKNANPHTFSVNYLSSDPSQVGLSYEFSGLTLDKKKSTNVVNLSYGMMNYEVEGFDFDGAGFVIELGHKNYFEKDGTFTGFYTANYLSYGHIQFDEETIFGKFDGTYSYFSFFSPDLGYKMQWGNFVLDPSIGGIWKIEIKGKGDIDNRYVDEWAFRAALKIGYNF